MHKCFFAIHDATEQAAGIMVAGAQLAAPKQTGPHSAQNPKGLSKDPLPVEQRSGSDDSSGCHFECPPAKDEQDMRWPGQQASLRAAVPDGGGRLKTTERGSPPVVVGHGLGEMDLSKVRSESGPFYRVL